MAEVLKSQNIITNGAMINGATAKTTPIDADMVGLMDSADNNLLKKLSWTNIKATLLSTAMTWTGKQTFDGGAPIKGVTDGTAIASGYIGEKVDFTSRSVSATTAAWVANSNAVVTVQPGAWLLVATGDADAASGLVSAGIGIFGDGSNGPTNLIHTGYSGTSGNRVKFDLTKYVNVSSATSYYLKSTTIGANTTVTMTGYAIRIA